MHRNQINTRMKKVYFTLFMLFAFLFIQKADAQLERYQSTFIYNFTRLVQWPNLQNELVFKIGVLGHNHPIISELQASASERNVGGRPIEIVALSANDDLTSCHILFVPNNQLSVLRRSASALNNSPVLVITESHGRMPAEASINLYVENERMVYQLDEEGTRSRNLTLSRQIVNFAR